MSFEANTEVMRTEAGKWDGVQTAMSGVHTGFNGNSTASGAFSVLGLPLGTEHDQMAVKLTEWSRQGAERFGVIGDTLLWIANNYTGTDADENARYGG